MWSVQFDVIEPDVRDEADEGEKTIQRSIRAQKKYICVVVSVSLCVHLYCSLFLYEMF